MQLIEVQTIGLKGKGVMTKISVGLTAGAFALILLIPIAHPQENSQDKPLGDVAREQKDANKQQNKTQPKKIFRNHDIASTLATPNDSDAKAQSSSTADGGSDVNVNNASASAPKATAAEKKANQPDSRNSRSVFDRPKDMDPEVILAPAGTAISVEITGGQDNHLEARVSDPVRVGFATPIPALSKATLRIIISIRRSGNLILP